jgi:hypothetical protein
MQVSTASRIAATISESRASATTSRSFIGSANVLRVAVRSSAGHRAPPRAATRLGPPRIVRSRRACPRGRTTRGTPANTATSAPTSKQPIRPDGNPIWTSAAMRSATRVTAAPNWVAAELNLPALADAGHDGTGHGIKNGQATRRRQTPRRHEPQRRPTAPRRVDLEARLPGLRIDVRPARQVRFGLGEERISLPSGVEGLGTLLAAASRQLARQLPAGWGYVTRCDGSPSGGG